MRRQQRLTCEKNTETHLWEDYRDPPVRRLQRLTCEKTHGEDQDCRNYCIIRVLWRLFTRTKPMLASGCDELTVPLHLYFSQQVNPCRWWIHQSHPHGDLKDFTVKKNHKILLPYIQTDVITCKYLLDENWYYRYKGWKGYKRSILNDQDWQQYLTLWTKNASETLPLCPKKKMKKRRDKHKWHVTCDMWHVTCHKMSVT